MIKQVCDFCGADIEQTNKSRSMYYFKRGVTDQVIFGMDLCKTCYTNFIAYVDKHRTTDAKEYYKGKDNL